MQWYEYFALPDTWIKLENNELKYSMRCFLSGNSDDINLQLLGLLRASLTSLEALAFLTTITNC